MIPLHLNIIHNVNKEYRKSIKGDSQHLRQELGTRYSLHIHLEIHPAESFYQRWHYRVENLYHRLTVINNHLKVIRALSCHQKSLC